jgi:hypothetical protein
MKTYPKRKRKRESMIVYTYMLLTDSSHCKD